jgi:hypothetical protein
MVAIVDEHARGRKVTRVTLEVGALSAVLPDAIAAPPAIAMVTAHRSGQTPVAALLVRKVRWAQICP